MTTKQTDIYLTRSRMTNIQTNIRTRYEGIQNVLADCGASGCFFLALVSIAEESEGKEIDLLDAIIGARNSKLIKDDFFVNDSVALLSLLTNKKWRRVILKPNELPAKVGENVYTIEKWVNNASGYTHFRRRYVDTLTNSQTVKNGVLSCYYTFEDLSAEEEE